MADLTTRAPQFAECHVRDLLDALVDMLNKRIVLLDDLVVVTGLYMPGLGAPALGESTLAIAAGARPNGKRAFMIMTPPHNSGGM